MTALTPRMAWCSMASSRLGQLRCALLFVVYYNRRDKFAASASAHRLLAGTSEMLGPLCVLAPVCVSPTGAGAA